MFLNVPFVEQEQGSDTDCSSVVYADIFWSSEHRERQGLAAPPGAQGALLALCCSAVVSPRGVWHVWAPAEPPWLSLGLHQPSPGGCCPAEKVAEFLHPDGESDGTGSSTRSQGVTELPG